MNNKLIRGIISLIIAVILSASLSISVSASDFFEIDVTEPEITEDHQHIIEVEIVLPEIYDSKSLTPEGNLTLIDDISGVRTSDKQFITVVTKSGNFFYIVIDRAGDRDNVHFLNLVDEADLMAILEGEKVQYVPPAPIMPEPPPEPVLPQEPEPVKVESSNNNLSGIILLLVLLGAGGGVAYYILKVRKPIQTNNSPPVELDEYDFDLNDDETDDCDSVFNAHFSAHDEADNADEDDEIDMENFKKAIRDINADNSSYTSDDRQNYFYTADDDENDDNEDFDDEDDNNEDNSASEDNEDHDMKEYKIPTRSEIRSFIHQPPTQYENTPYLRQPEGSQYGTGENDTESEDYSDPICIQNELRKHRDNRDNQPEQKKKSKNSKTIRITFDFDDEPNEQER